jgi:tetratricopeptide (TPR) repeat protein
MDASEMMLRTAARRDSGNAAVCAALARVSSLVGDFAEAVTMAERTHRFDLICNDLEPQRHLDTALIGARAALERGNGEAATRFYVRALAVDPEHADALAEYGETLAGLGDLAGARAAFETRLAIDVDDEKRALHLAMLGAALMDAGETDSATERFEAAIEADAGLDRAHEELVRLHEKLDQIDDGIACLERWADAANSGTARAERLLQAAEWEIRAAGREEAAEQHLRQVLDAAPELPRAWELLANLLWERGNSDDALEVAALALEGITDSGARGRLAVIRGRALEQRGERREAAEAFGIAADETPDCVEAALSAARLLRGLGKWQPAADTLRKFVERNPDSNVAGLADVLQQLGRLLAGPLEDVEGAIAAYRRAVDLDPERVDTRAALAEFLSHRTSDQEESLAHHEAILEADPTHASSLRVLMRIARERGDATTIATGLAILRSLGICSPSESEEELPAAPASFAGDRKLLDPVWEKLRLIAHEAAEEISSALESSERSPAAPSTDPTETFRAAALAAESELTASALLPLSQGELAEVLTLVAALSLEPDQVDGDGRMVNALSTAIRRRKARRLRKILAETRLAEIQGIDFGAWRTEVRALAAAVAIDETGGDLRTALRVLIATEGDHNDLRLPEDADLTPYVAAYPQAGALLRRAVRTWLQRL